MNKAITLSNENFKSEVIDSPVPVLVDFWAPWCGPCQMMAPVLDELASETEGKLKVAKLDIHDPAHQELAVLYQVQSIPNLKLFKGGQVVKELVGFRDKASLMGELASEL